METKTCTNCLIDFEINESNFYKKKNSYKLKSGEVKYFYKYTSICRKCHGVKGNERRVKNRCKELGCDVKDYRENWIEEMAKNNTKYESIKGAEESKISYIRKKCKQGYVFTTMDKYKLDVDNNYKKAAFKRRKIDYGHKLKLTDSEMQRAAILRLTDSRIAQSLGLSVNDCPKELIDQKRVIIQIKRELGLTRDRKQINNYNYGS